MTNRSVYDEALTDKEFAAKLLIPLIEFEFSFQTDDSPSLVQSKVNRSSLDAIFQICRHHNWTTTEDLMEKGRDNLYFRIPTKAFREIYTLAGPFADERKHQWADLIVERSGHIGGYRVGTQKTKDRIHSLMLTQPGKVWTTFELCMTLRLLPRTIREGLRHLLRAKLVQKERKGKTVFWTLR
jgi:hypothetical protein